MSLYDYRFAIDLTTQQEEPPFCSLIMAAMLRADSDNSIKLAEMFPETYAELVLRYNAPEGRLKDD